jgi:hypothetical protein
MTNSVQQSAPSQALISPSFLQGHADTLFDTGMTDSPAWAIFAQSWHDLRQDEYMGDSGKYRFRRYSEFFLDRAARTVSVLAHVPYRQSKEDNYLNGGIDRLYSPMREDIQANQVFRQVLFSCADVLAPLHPLSEWVVQVFQNRIVANPSQPGKPTPEGIHRDGVDYVLTLLIKRHNVDGGESSVYAQDGRTLKASVTLKEPGDFILLDDRQTKHDVQPIVQFDSAEEGYRDMLIAMFTQRTRPDLVPA